MGTADPRLSVEAMRSLAGDKPLIGDGVRDLDDVLPAGCLDGHVGQAGDDTAV